MAKNIFYLILRLFERHVVAEMCESFLTDEKVVQRISQKVYETDKGLWNTIKKWFDDLVAKLKKLFADLDPQSENGRIVRDMGDRLDAVRQMWADMVVEAGAAEESGADSMVKSSKKDFEDYNKPITVEDVNVIRTIPSKTSVNNFTAEEIKNTQKWAYKFYQELNVKSPFFRAWFGEWRAHDATNINVAPIPSMPLEEQRSKNGIRNVDTSLNGKQWNIIISGQGERNTESHSGNDKRSVRGLTNIKGLLENAVLFDSEIHEVHNPNKNDLIAFDHKLYSLGVNDEGIIALYKMTVEEQYQDWKHPDVKRFHNLKYIEKIAEIDTKKVATLLEGRQDIKKSRAVSFSEQLATKYSIADLYEFVKTFDKEFTPAPEVNKVLLNEDGTPKKFYHGTDAKFTEFKPEEMSHKEGSYFFAENREDAEAYGKNIHEVYLTGRKLADYDNQPYEFYKLRDKRKQVEWLKERGYDGWYADMDSGGWGELSVFSPEQIKSAKGNIGTFSRYETDTKYSRKEDEAYLNAVNRGDMETAQIMVDEAAKNSGYNSPKLFHGTGAFGFTRIDTKKSNDHISFFATNSKETAGTYSGTNDVRNISDAKNSNLGMYQLYANTNGMLEFDAKGAESNRIELGQMGKDYNDFVLGKSWYNYATAKQIAKYAKQRGYSGVVIKNVIDSATPDSRKVAKPADVYIFFNPQAQVKSADPVTYDDEGNVIPLSQRFNAENEDIRYSRKTVDPITSREELAKALSKVAKGEDRAIVESYKANVNLIKGETVRLESLRKEIDEIKYKKSITYEGRELSVKEFEQIAYTRAEEMGIEAQRVKNKGKIFSKTY